MDKFNTFVNSNFEGVERVKNSKGKYAFFVENTVLEYITERNCELTQVGGMLDRLQIHLNYSLFQFEY